MRPARKGPENSGSVAGDWADSARFNEAGPQGAGKRRPALPGNGQRVAASMRPARKGPENAFETPGRGARPGRFNEAGPQGAGKLEVEPEYLQRLTPLQ